MDYKEAGFKLALVGSDEVVRAFSNIMQHFYQGAEETKQIGLDAIGNAGNKLQGNHIVEKIKSNNKSNTFKTMKLLGVFLLAIRRSVGNEATSIGDLEMLRWMITDIDNYLEENNNTEN